MKIKGPINRRVLGNSSCPSQRLSALDWSNWWLDHGFGDGCYLHVRHICDDGDETWHRVYPHRVKGRVCHRVAVYGGVLYWLHDEPKGAGERVIG